METQVIIVGSVQREARAAALASVLGGVVVWDHNSRGALWNHIQALKVAAALSERGIRSIIMEDDAIPVLGFLTLAKQAIAKKPSDMISFYLGTGRPPQWQADIDNLLELHDQMRFPTGFIRLPQLIHGVCYTFPPELAQELHELARNFSGPADYVIGRAWSSLGGVIHYCVESLVDHADGPPVERHPDGQPRTERRVARRLHGGLK